MFNTAFQLPRFNAVVALTLLSTAAAAGSVDVRAEMPQSAMIQKLELRLKEDPKDYVTEVALIQLELNECRYSGALQPVRKAAQRLDAILAEVPDYQQALIVRANVAMTLHQFAKAEELATRAGHLFKAEVTAATLLADAQLEQGKIEDAEKTLARIPVDKATEPSILVRRARIVQLRGDFTSAEKFLKQALKSVEENRVDDVRERAWFELALGRFYFARGQFIDAESHYSKAREIAPDWWMISDHLGELRGAQRRFEESISLFTTSFERSHRSEVAHALGDLLVAAGKSSDASRWFTIAQDGYNEATSAGFDYYLHHQAHLFSDSMEQPDRAVELARKDRSLRITSDTDDQLGWSLYKAGELESAKISAEGALRNGSFVPHVLYHAAMIYGALGEVEKSKELLAKAAHINPEFMQFHVHR